MSKSFKQNFLQQKKEEKENRELQKKKIAMASKIYIFYRNGKICQQKLQFMIESCLPKIATVVSIETLKDKQTFIKACNLALNKYPEFLKPFVLLKQKNVHNYSSYVINILKLFNGSIQQKSDSFISQIFAQKGLLIKRLNFLKSIQLGLYLLHLQKNSPVGQEIINTLNELFVQFHTNFQKEQIDYFYTFFQKFAPQIMQDILGHVINYQGFQVFIVHFLTKKNHIESACNLAYEFILKSEAALLDYSTLVPLLMNSTSLNTIIQQKFASDQEIVNINILYRKLQDQNVENNQMYLDVLTNLILFLEKQFFRIHMLHDLKNIESQLMPAQKQIQLLRKKKEHQLFLEHISIQKLLNIIQKVKQVEIQSLSKFLYLLIQLAHHKKLEMKLTLSKLDLIQEQLHYYVLYLSTLEMSQVPYEAISIYCSFKALEFQFLDDKEFKALYLSNEQRNIECNQIFGFITEYAKYCMLNGINSQIYKEMILYIRELFERNQILSFHNWKYDQALNILNSPQIINKLPFLSEFSLRIDKFNQYLELDKKNYSRSIHDLFTINDDGEPVVKQSRLILIRRGQEFEDSYDQLENKQLKNAYHIKFFNQMGLPEDGIDGGGVTKEFITRVVNQALDPNFGLFIETNERTIMPNPVYLVSEKQKYAFIGKIIGKAIYEGVLIEKVLSQVFLNQVLGISNTVNDFRYYDLDQYHRLCNLKNQDVTDFGLTFSMTQDVYGQIQEIDLKPNGKQISVTNENKQEYISLYCNFKLNKQIKEQSAIFRQGLEELIDPEKLKLFTNFELQLLISGQPVIDIHDLISYTNYKGYFPHDKTIQDLWHVLNNFEYEQQSQFLYFVSSCSRAPTQGFKSLDPPFMIQKVPIQNKDDLQKLPTASTCFNILKLPDYQNQQLLRLKLQQAISSNTGFELT